jgi:flavin reductase (DIM6/NTAB) family NADH-FMN oxidoreductase RutF
LERGGHSVKKKVPLALAYRLINHGPVVLVSTFYRGRPNVCPISWVTPVDSDLVAIVISEENYTFTCIEGTGEFVVNVPPRSLLKEVIKCGAVSGAKVRKFDRFNLTPGKSEKLEAPIVEECIGHLECRLLKGEERMARKYNIFLAEVVAASAERSLFTTRWDVRKSRARTLHHLGGNKFATPARTLL